MRAILPGLFLLPIPIPFPLKAVNLYLFRKDGEVALVDTGLDTRAARGSLELFLSELGLCFSDVKTVLLTHHHPDHYGLAGFLEGLGARVYLHPEELSRGHRFWQDPEAYEEASMRLFLEHGTPKEALLGIREVMAETRRRVHPPARPLPLEEGTPLELGGYRLKPLHTPGHADGHLAFFLEEEGLLLAGDTLLERVSPNIGLWAYTRENPLRDFLQTLRRLAELPARLAYGGHFGPLPNPQARARELLEHHERRLEEILALLKAPQDAWSLSLGLFPEELDPAGRRFAFAETLAHLEYLRAEGLLGREGPPYRYFRV